MRLTQTGTGRGQVVGRGRLDFHAQQDRTIRSCAVSWDGDAVFVPLLPGLAFDQYFPNLRSEMREGRVLIGKDAQRATLAEFEDWVTNARARLDAHEALPRFEALPLAGPKPGALVAEQANFVVRLNDGRQRLWSDTSYSSNEGRSLLFHLLYRLLWDWCIGHDDATMLRVLERQLDHYDVHGIPSDVMMRQIGRAPHAPWQAV